MEKDLGTFSPVVAMTVKVLPREKFFRERTASMDKRPSILE